MNYSRREIGRIALGSVPASALAATAGSNFGGVQVGIIAPYSFRGLYSDADSLLANIRHLGLSAVEMQNDRVEAYAGAPSQPRVPFRRRGRGGRPSLAYSRATR